MKKIILLFGIIYILFSCTGGESDSEDCGCVKEFWEWRPAMNGPDGNVLIPEKYTFIFSNIIPCGKYPVGYQTETGPNYTKVKYVCKN